MVFLVSGLLLILGVKIVTKLEFLPLLVAIKDSWKDDPMTQGMYGVGGIGLLYVLFKELKSLAFAIGQRVKNLFETTQLRAISGYYSGDGGAD
ncbi:MAG: hypothetical protein HRT37_08825 [Alteromonadaceae bacterium]|nr:hypothetical protein [Alteromonadaceae bacterium]